MLQQSTSISDQVLWPDARIRLPLQEEMNHAPHILRCLTVKVEWSPRKINPNVSRMSQTELRNNNVLFDASDWVSGMRCVTQDNDNWATEKHTLKPKTLAEFQEFYSAIFRLLKSTPLKATRKRTDNVLGIQTLSIAAFHKRSRNQNGRNVHWLYTFHTAQWTSAMPVVL